MSEKSELGAAKMELESMNAVARPGDDAPLEREWAQ
jgi:hypothetical protein